MSKIWISEPIQQYMEINPDISLDDLKVAFSQYTPNTVRTQYGRILRIMRGLPSRTYDKKKKKSKSKSKSKSRIVTDAKQYQESLDKLSSIPRATFIPANEAGTAATGNKRHVNLVTAEQEDLNKEALYAEAWVTWLKYAEGVPCGDEINFLAWIKEKPQNSEHRKAKLIKRYETFKQVCEKLSFAMEYLQLCIEEEQKDQKDAAE